MDWNRINLLINVVRAVDVVGIDAVRTQAIKELTDLNVAILNPPAPKPVAQPELPLPPGARRV